MKKAEKATASRILPVILWVLVLCMMAGGCSFPLGPMDATVPTDPPVTEPPATEPPVTEPPATEPPATEPPVTEPEHHWEPGYVATLALEAEYYDEEGQLLGTLLRGTQVEYELTAEGETTILLDEQICYLQEGATVVTDHGDIIPPHTLYVRTAVNLRNVNGKLIPAFAEKGTAVKVTGFDYLYDDGEVHMYRVKLDGVEGYIMPWYLADNEADALANYDNGYYSVHAGREDLYGGGGAANLDFYPREKGPIPGNDMPAECRTLYLVNWRLDELDAYLEIANNSGINAFVVDIVDGAAIGYASEVMKVQCPSAAEAAYYSMEDYQAIIQRIKDEGYYVIGRITAFNDYYFVKDHPEYAITDLEGDPLRLSGEYWPTAFSRAAWQYKVDLAVEAVEVMGFDEIQFDYVRFPDSTWWYEDEGIIDFHNDYGETKAQAIQRFLMYATDIIHEHGAYVSADVYGESAYTYVTAYGQYWAAISNVVDVISGMPYPDHFSPSGDWLPWEHPYETLYSWGCDVMRRQAETATPAIVRTWIQAYNAIREPYNIYGASQIAAQISGLRDAGCTGGYMTWNAMSSIDKYTWLMPAFEPAEEE